MDVQWYPGHMTKARRAMERDLKLVDLIIEILDARIPSASRNPELAEMGKNRLRLIILNKADLADPAETERWLAWFRKQGMTAAALDSRVNSSRKAVLAAIEQAAAAKRERDRKRGIVNRPVRAMVVGVPNTGKSTFINCLNGKAAARTGNKPGVTRGTQWIRLGAGVELMDTPGVLWPKIADEREAVHLAALGSVSDLVTDTEELAREMIRELAGICPGVMEEMAGQAADPGEPGAWLEAFAVKRGCLLPGGKTDTGRAAALFLDDLRAGKHGRITLEAAPAGDTE